MRGSRLLSLALLCCLSPTMCGCSGPWQPVDGKDAEAYKLTVPVLHRDETHTITVGIFINGSETIPWGFQVKLEVFRDDSHTVLFCAPMFVTHPTDIASGRAVDIEFSLPVVIAEAVGSTLYFVATADPLDNVAEAIETNNVIEATGQVELEHGVDLVVESIALPDYMLRASSYDVTVSVRNVGDRPATAPFSVKVEEPDESWSHTWQVDTDLAPGGTRLLSIDTYTVGSAAALGDRTFTATADTTTAVVERDEDNNSRAEIAPVATMDLALSLVSFDPTYTPGSPYHVTLRVTNNGSIPSPATTVSVSLRDSVVAPYVTLEMWPPLTVPVLAQGASVDIDGTVIISSGSSVDRHLVYVVDGDLLIEEDNELNNVAVIIQPPQ